DLAASESFHSRDKDSCRERLATIYGIDSPFVLYVGRLQARKNLPRLIEAFAQARRNGVRQKLVLVGKRDFGFGQVQARIRALRLESSVVLTGHVSADDLPPVYNATEVFV